MHEFICPQTQEPCELGNVCARQTALVRSVIEEVALHEREAQELHLRGLLARQFVTEGGVARPLTAQEIQEMNAAESSPEHAAGLAELDVHLSLQERLPFPFRPENPESPHDSYDQLTRTICLYGTAKMVETILEQDEGRRNATIANLILRANSTNPASSAE